MEMFIFPAVPFTMVAVVTQAASGECYLSLASFSFH